MDTMFAQRVRRLVRDEGGQDLIEYALLTGIIAIGWLLIGTPLQNRMKTNYETRNAATNSLSATPAPTP